MGEPNPNICRSCYKTAETEPVQVKRNGQWVDSTVRRCVDSTCHAVREGSLDDRVAHILSVYGYKYFGDYDLSPEQLDAVGEAVTLASRVPTMAAFIEKVLPVLEHTATLPGGWPHARELFIEARALLNKTRGEGG